MINDFFHKKLNKHFHFQLLKSLLVVTMSAALLIYISMHIIFLDFPFDTSTELITLLKLLGIATAFAIAVSGLVLVADAADFLILRKKQFTMPDHIKILTSGLLVIVVLLSACNSHVSVGIKKDFNTGMASSYTNMEPQKVLLVMNNEVLNHTDIPLGESFLVVNDGITGMQANDGKVKIGCALRITDQKGKVLMDEKDLFAGHDEFAEQEARMLKCTVNTGDPMQWEEKYNVAVTFWDKNGTGKIENMVTIRSIDMP
jgi:uncharacterized membrane protein